jgi:hypothetical protein
VILHGLKSFTLVFTPQLKTREQIQVTVFFTVAGCGANFYLTYIPFNGLPDPREGIQQAIFAEASAVVNRWVLQFASAVAAVDDSAYDSLTHRLSAITSSGFIVRKVVVQQIISLSAPIPTPEPQSVLPSLEDETLQPIRNVLPVFTEAIKLDDHIKKNYPHLYNHPEFGVVTTTVDGATTFLSKTAKKGKLGLMFETAVSRLLTHPSRK